MTKITDGCWYWSGAKHHKGYGNLRGRMAHRISYEQFIGPIPKGLQLDHLCEAKNCVNPFHLEPVTNQENKLRWADNLTHCPQGHPYDSNNTRIETYQASYGVTVNKKRCIKCSSAQVMDWAKRNPKRIAMHRDKYRKRKFGIIDDQDGVEVVRLGRK